MKSVCIKYIPNIFRQYISNIFLFCNDIMKTHISNSDLTGMVRGDYCRKKSNVIFYVLYFGVTGPPDANPKRW